jgi:hypothetical protein
MVIAAEPSFGMNLTETRLFTGLKPLPDMVNVVMGATEVALMEETWIDEDGTGPA